MQFVEQIWRFTVLKLRENNSQVRDTPEDTTVTWIKCNVVLTPFRAQ